MTTKTWGRLAACFFINRSTRRLGLFLSSNEVLVPGAIPPRRANDAWVLIRLHRWYSISRSVVVWWNLCFRSQEVHRVLDRTAHLDSDDGGIPRESTSNVGGYWLSGADY